ncbi:MAG: glycine cleavage system protein GcvH [Sulfurimonas sp.]|jgi:glycine cleavage system H protein|nr:glycine cleavage system protein GcvH [Sulfurimonas sp.]
MKRYSNEHEWSTLEGDIATVGLSEYAVEQLGDITFVELPEIGTIADQDDSIAFIESVKAASDIYTPLGGEVVEVNIQLDDTPELINEDAEGTWIMKIKVSDASEFETLMDEAAYKAYIETL